MSNLISRLRGKYNEAIEHAIQDVLASVLQVCEEQASQGRDFAEFTQEQCPGAVIKHLRDQGLYVTIGEGNGLVNVYGWAG